MKYVHLKKQQMTNESNTVFENQCTACIGAHICAVHASYTSQMKSQNEIVQIK